MNRTVVATQVYSIALLSLLGLFTACSSVETRETKPVELTSAEQSSTLMPITPTQLCDCFLDAVILVWNDEDRDGTFDKSEPPMEGVEFRLRVNDESDLAVTTSDAQGSASLSYATNQCECFRWTSTIVFEIPSGYEVVSEKWQDAQNHTGRMYEVAMAQTQIKVSPTP